MSECCGALPFRALVWFGAVSERAEIGVEVWGEIVTNCVREGGRGW